MSNLKVKDSADKDGLKKAITSRSRVMGSLGSEMGRVYRFEGKNIEEAIKKAETTLKLKRESLEIKSIEQVRAGLLGLFGKRVRLKVSIKDDDPIFGKIERPGADGLQEVHHLEPQDEDGTVAIIDGVVRVKPPKGNGRFPVLSPGSGVNLLVNGVKASGPIIVVPEDCIEVEAVPARPFKRLEVAVSRDQMTAELIVYPPYQIVKRIQDAGPAPILELKVREEAISVPPVTVEEAYEELRMANVVFGLLNDEVVRAVAEASGKPVVVARGRPKVDGTDGYLEFVFAPKTDSESKEGEGGHCLYVESSEVRIVEIGEVIARIVAPLEGRAGMTVTGKEIMPSPPKPAQYVLGRGVREIDERLVAAISGRLNATGKLVEVIPLLVIKGDVNLKTGNIRFNGDVQVEGSVTQGMAVEAQGMVTVKGMVEGAEISARDGIITLSMVVNSKVRAGARNIASIKPIIPLVRQLLYNLEILQSALEEVLRHIGVEQQAEIRVGRIIRPLIENKVGDLPKTAKKVVSICEKSEIDLEEELLEAVKQIGNLGLNPYERTGEMCQRITWMIGSLKEWLVAAEQMTAKRATVRLAYALNSEIYAAGSILVRGQGCFNTLLSAGENVSVTGNPGVFRGGQIIASGDVYVNELGAEGGSVIRITIPGNKMVRCGSIPGSALITVGHKTISIENHLGAAMIFMDSKGNIIHR